MNKEVDIQNYRREAALKAQEILDAARILAEDNGKRVTVSNNGRLVYRLWNRENPEEKPEEIVDEAPDYPEELQKWMSYHTEARTKEGDNRLILPSLIENNVNTNEEITLRLGVEESIIGIDENLR